MNALLLSRAATLAANGMLTGASLDQSVKQLPARRVIGPAAYAAYARAADGGNGIAWYATLGAGTAALTLATAAATLRAGPSPRARTAAAAAGILSLAHSLTTTKAAPIMLGLRRDDRGSQQLAEALDRFQRWQTIRAILQAATLGASLMLSLETHRRRG